MSLYVQRHAATAHNSENPSEERIRGWGDIGLSAEGKQQAIQAAGALKEKPPSVIFTSDLPRAKETADLMAQELGGVPVVPARELRTWNVGAITGQPVSEAKPQLDALQHTQRTKPAPKGESYQAFYDRWGRIVKQLQQVAQGQDVLVVVHGRQVYSLPNILAGKGPAGVPTHGDPAPGAILSADNGKVHYVHKPSATAVGEYAAKQDVPKPIEQPKPPPAPPEPTPAMPTMATAAPAPLAAPPIHVHAPAPQVIHTRAPDVKVTTPTMVIPGLEQLIAALNRREAREAKAGTPDPALASLLAEVKRLAIPQPLQRPKRIEFQRENGKIVGATSEFGTVVFERDADGRILAARPGT